MSLSRYQVRNVYSLANPELYKAADTDDPEALLEGVAMAGLVGVIRQLGDLAEFAAEIFHGLHEEMTATAARSHGLLARVQQLELEIPSTEKAFLSQTCSSAFFPNSGINWHPNSNRQTSQNLITMGDLPRFVMESYEECRAPPRLFLLDKFDVGGAGACLKRYTDPSYYKVEVSSYEIESAETQRDIKIRKTKKKDSEWKRGQTHKVSQPSHIKLHQLFLEDCVQNGTIEPTRRVKLKKRPNIFPFDSETGQSYMSKLLNSPSKVKFVRQPPVYSSIIPLPSDTSERPTILIVEDPIGSDLKIRSPSVSPSVDRDLTTSALSLAAGGGSFAFVEEVNEKQITVDETDVVQNGDKSDDVASETENYVDALATMELELETEAKFIAKTDDPNVNHGTYSDRHNSRNSTEITSIVGVDSPPRFTFASTEIPFRPRMRPQQVSIDEKICGTQHSDENYETPNTPNKHSDLSTCDGLSSFKFVRNSDIERHNDGFSPVIHLPNILETSLRIREDDHCTGSVDSRCGFPNSVISQPFGLPLAEHDPEEQLKETGDDDVLHIFDSKFSFFSHDETEKNNSKVQLVTGKDCVVLEDESELKEPKTESDHVSVPDDLDRNDENALSTLEDDTELEGKEMENSVVLLPADVDKNEDNNARSTVEEPEATIFLQKQMEMEKNDDNSMSFLQDLAEITQNGEQKIEDKVDPQLLVASGSSELLSQLDSPIHETYSGSDPNLSVQSIIQEEIPQGERMTVPVTDTPPNGHDIDLFDQVKHQSHPELYPTNLASQNAVQMEDPHGKPIIVSASENQPTFDLPQENSHDIELFDQVKHQLPPVFPGFGVLPKLPPVKLEDMPPLPPLPPMQWRMRKLENPLLTPTDSGQYNNGSFRFPPFFQSKSDEVSELAAGLPPLDENKVPDTENQIFEHEPSLQTEAIFAENMDPQAAVETDSGSEIVYSNPPGDEMLTSIRPIKIQQPRSPLIDAVATHDKTKLRKASDRAMPHIPENKILLEQIRTKSFKLKPAVQTRPSIHSPTTNMRVAAILEKANAIRQAFAGSDDENDSWSD